MPMADRAMANELAISANPMRMAQFSYDLITSVIMEIIPLAVKAGKDSRNKEVIREILAVLNNKLYQARDAYYNAITLGMIQGCNGVGLMLGYTNPWALWVRKQCEIMPLAVQVRFFFCFLFLFSKVGN